MRLIGLIGPIGPIGLIGLIGPIRLIGLIGPTSLDTKPFSISIGQ